MLLNFINGGQYHPEYLNIGIKECASGSDKIADLWIAKAELYRLAFPVNVIGAIRIGQIFKCFNPGEACAWLSILRSWVHDEKCRLSIDGYDTAGSFDPVVALLLEACGFILGNAAMRHEAFQSARIAEHSQKMLGDEAIQVRVDQYLRLLSRGDTQVYAGWKKSYETLRQGCGNHSTGSSSLPEAVGTPAYCDYWGSQVIFAVAGGLGDQFFRYAAARLISLQNQEEIKYDDTNMRAHYYGGRSCIYHHFNTVGQFASKQDFANLLSAHISATKHVGDCQSPFAIIKGEDHMRFAQRPFRILYLSEPPFFWPEIRPVLPLLKREFTLKEPPSGENAKMEECIKSCRNAVSIHIRLTDFGPIGLAVSMDYYLKAILMLENRLDCPWFFIFSDDMESVKGQFAGMPRCTFVEQNDQEHGYEDFRLMKLCRHHILCKSSFSWWAALLSEYEDKLVIHPGHIPSPGEWIFLQDH